jgi:hypothetical protein
MADNIAQKSDPVDQSDSVSVLNVTAKPSAWGVVSQFECNSHDVLALRHDRQTVQGTLTARLGERKVRARNLMIGAFVES